MCGIIGSIKISQDHVVDAERFQVLVDGLDHRGPDDWGVHHDRNFSFGHRRLSVIDLSRNARQPMSDGDGRVYITYNGEIYNYPEIRDELLEKGHHFNSKSDTEVILEAYKEWGIDCIKKFNGMFAFALYDLDKDEFYLVRDRLGIKPVYYSQRDDVLLFCSELKGIVNYPGFVKRLNLKAVSCFLSFRYCMGSDTYFENVHQLKPGHYMLFKDGRMEIEKYWDIDLGKRKWWLSKRYRKKLKSLIGDAVRLRTISDVPLGSYLSGGLDSTIILNEMSKNNRNSVKTFTVTFDEKGYDESYYSDLAARKYKSDACKINLDGRKYLDYVEELIKYKDQPLGYHNEIASYLIARILKKDVTVVLSGEGADEIFSGYGRLFRSPFDYKRLKIINRLPMRMRKKVVDYIGLDERYAGKSPLDHFLMQYSYFPIEEKNEIYNDEMKMAADNDEHIYAMFEGEFERAKHRSYYDRISYVFEKMHLPGLLQMVDTTSMAAGVEVRVPFVDHRVVQESFNIPSRYKMKWRSCGDRLKALFKSSGDLSENNDITKYVLKSIYSGEIPEEIIERKKMVFPVPLTEWFTGEHKEHVRRELLGEDSRIKMVFDQDKLRRWMDEKEKGGDERYGRKIWMILNLEYWLRLYF